ncbi:MAG: Rid family detoxifying hydrolase [Elusimicrobiota bacterium]
MNKKKIIKTDKASPAIGPYSQAVKYNGIIYVSGQLPMDRKGNLVKGTVSEKTHKVMKNIGAILEKADSSFENVLKVRVCVDNLENFNKINKIYTEYFPEAPPARAFVQVAQLPKGAELEIEVIAAA